jgi:hypothetical protein
LKQNEKRKICFKNKNCDHLCRAGQLCFLSLNWIYHTDEEYVLLKILENNHKCVPFGLFITNINVSCIAINFNFFLSLAVFGFILNKIPFKWYKVLYYLKRCLYTEIIFVHSYKFFLLLLLVLFLCLLKIVY